MRAIGFRRTLKNSITTALVFKDSKLREEVGIFSQGYSKSKGKQLPVGLGIDPVDPSWS